MNETTRPARAIVIFLVGAAGLAFGQGHWPSGIALIIGIAAMTRFVRDTRPAVALPLFVVAHILVWEWAYAGMVPLPTFARLGMEAGTSIVLAAVFASDRWIARRMPSFGQTLALPCGWVAFDLAMARLSPGATWGSIAYTFGDDLVVAQLASLVGWTGLTFFAAWLAAALNWEWERHREESSAVGRGLVTMGIVAVVVCAYGVVRIATAPVGPPVRVACVVPPDIFNDESLDALWAYTRGVERPAESIALARSRIDESMDQHFEMVDRAADEGARLVVWPEANPVITAAEKNRWIERAAAMARARKIFIGMGMVVFRPSAGEPSQNMFVLVDPTGEVAISFLKATRVPGTGHAIGDGLLPTVDTSLGRIAAAICFDLDFPHVIAQAGSNNADVILGPSNDWAEVRATHARMARLRSIEQGCGLVRPTKDGVTLITDATGRTRGMMSLGDDQTGVIVVELPVLGRPTVYAAVGDLFAWLCCLGLGLLCAASIRR